MESPGGVLMCGGSSAKTDRAETLKSYGDLSDVFSTLNRSGKGLLGSGASDTGKASKYYSAILSGNPSAVLEAAAPEINSINKEADAQKKDIANFGNRTGGTNATSQDISTAKRGQIADVISGKRAGAAEGEARIGAGETGAGIGAVEGAGQTADELGNLSVKSRELSQKIHDQAVKNWASLVQDVFTGKGALTALSSWGG
jgi:hypothetical protein